MSGPKTGPKGVLADYRRSQARGRAEQQREQQRAVAALKKKAMVLTGEIKSAIS
jgi:hypothetical protein